MYTGAGIIKIYAGRTGHAFAQRMCSYLGTQLGDAETMKFSEGNVFVRINESIRDKDVYIVQPIGREPNDEFTELLFWIDAFKRASANSVTAIIPYFSYAKGDKKDEPRVSIRARVCADCIEVVGVDRVIFMDLHSPQVQGFFKKPVDHLYAQPLLCEFIRRQNIMDDDFVVVSPDAGSAKRARQVADELNRPVAIGDKIRYGHDEQARVLEIIGDVKGKNCLVVDDFSISAGTLVDVARGLKKEGANKLYAALSHNVMDEKALKRIQDSPYEFLVTTDTVECPEAAHYSKIRIISAAPMFAQAVRTIHDRAPMSTMFDNLVSKRLLDMSLNETADLTSILWES
ncbi:MAG: ribose-phosphate diphosphokinase [Clostridiales bacterium]|nr:ribose-phosphate diphosphokinase [Clostridiales bacterium]